MALWQLGEAPPLFCAWNEAWHWYGAVVVGANVLRFYSSVPDNMSRLCALAWHTGYTPFSSWPALRHAISARPILHFAQKTILDLFSLSSFSWHCFHSVGFSTLSKHHHILWKKCWQQNDVKCPLPYSCTNTVQLEAASRRVTDLSVCLCDRSIPKHLLGTEPSKAGRRPNCIFIWFSLWFWYFPPELDLNMYKNSPNLHVTFLSEVFMN